MRRVLTAVGAVVLLAACGAEAPQSPSTSAPVAGIASPTTRGSPTTTATPTATYVATPAATPTYLPTPTAPPARAAVVPAMPTGVTFATDVVELPGPTGTDELTYRDTHTVTWESPRADGVEIRVYGVTACLSAPSSPPLWTSGPCLVEHTLLPPAAMVLAGTAPAAAGEISWIAAFPQECGEAVVGADGTMYGAVVGADGSMYGAVVIAAYNAVGNSIFAIAHRGGWWQPGPDDVIC